MGANLLGEGAVILCLMEEKPLDLFLTTVLKGTGWEGALGGTAGERDAWKAGTSGVQIEANGLRVEATEGVAGAEEEQSSKLESLP